MNRFCAADVLTFCAVSNAIDIDDETGGVVSEHGVQITLVRLGSPIFDPGPLGRLLWVIQQGAQSVARNLEVMGEDSVHISAVYFGAEEAVGGRRVEKQVRFVGGRRGCKGRPGRERDGCSCDVETHSGSAAAAVE